MARPFHIALSPVRTDIALSLDRAGETLIVNGLRIDCAALPEGGRIAAEATCCDLLLSDIRAEEGGLHLTLLLPHGADAGPDALWPQPLVLAEDGAVVLPS